MFICFFALWIVLNGRWTTEIALFGLVFAAIAYAFTWKYMGYTPKVDLALVLRLPSAIRYGCTLVSEIVKANLTTARMILTKSFEPQPQLVHFEAPLKKNRHLVALSNSITLTPGTITVELCGSDLWVHALDASLVEGLDDSVFVQALEKMERRGMKKAADPVTDGLTEDADKAEECAAADAQAEAAQADEPDQADGGESAEAEEAEEEAEQEAEKTEEAKEENHEH